MQICATCGAENTGKKAACWNCWGPLDAPATAERAQQGSRAPGLSLRLPWKLLLAVALVVAVGAGVWLLVLTSKPEQVAAAYLDASLNGLFVSPERGPALQEKLLSGGMLQDLLPGALRLAYAEAIPPANVTGDMATVPATFQITINGDKVTAQTAANAVVLLEALKQQFRAEVTLVKEGTKWKVDQLATRRSLVDSAVRQAPPHLQGFIRDGVIPVQIVPPAPPAGAPKPPTP